MQDTFNNIITTDVQALVKKHMQWEAIVSSAEQVGVTILSSAEKVDWTWVTQMTASGVATVSAKWDKKDMNEKQTTVAIGAVVTSLVLYLYLDRKEDKKKTKKVNALKFKEVQAKQTQMEMAVYTGMPKKEVVALLKQAIASLFSSALQMEKMQTQVNLKLVPIATEHNDMDSYASRIITFIDNEYAQAVQTTMLNLYESFHCNEQEFLKAVDVFKTDPSVFRWVRELSRLRIRRTSVATASNMDMSLFKVLEEAALLLDHTGTTPSISGAGDSTYALQESFTPNVSYDTFLTCWLTLMDNFTKAHVKSCKEVYKAAEKTAASVGKEWIDAELKLRVDIKFDCLNRAAAAALKIPTKEFMKTQCYYDTNVVSFGAKMNEMQDKYYEQTKEGIFELQKNILLLKERQQNGFHVPTSPRSASCAPVV